MLCRVLPLKMDELIMSLYPCLSVISLLLHLRLWGGKKKTIISMLYIKHWIILAKTFLQLCGRAMLLFIRVHFSGYSHVFICVWKDRASADTLAWQRTRETWDKLLNRLRSLQTKKTLWKKKTAFDFACKKNVEIINPLAKTLYKKRRERPDCCVYFDVPTITLLSYETDLRFYFSRIN